MKSLILLLAVIGTLNAAEITFTIPDNKVDSLAAAVAYHAPIPVDSANNPIMSERAWAKEYYRQHMIRIFRKWKKNEQAKNVQTQDDLVE